ncbi:MAG: amidophosphoribosyltransferase [Bacteroidales bacterium]|nr:amidophosphoribosyltransferase [Bacteroidales bacterium]
METLKHECGVAMIRLLKPLSYYQEKYGTWRYGLNKLYLLMEKQHNRGQEGAGLACVKLNVAPGEEFMFRERASGSSAIEEIFKNIATKFKEEEQHYNSVHEIEQHLPYAGELYMGHLRYSTTGKRGLSYVHPFMRRNNWRAKNLCFCANFNLTNVDEVFDIMSEKGQHPRMVADTFLLLEQLGHRLDRESERCFEDAKRKGLTDQAITNYIEKHINVANILKEAAPSWDGGYVICGLTGSGELFSMRDPWGIRPAFWYKDDEVLVIASERPVIQTTFDLDVHDVHEMLPGQAILMTKDGNFRTEQVLEPKNFSGCSFERIYFSRGSDADIYQERKELGKQLVLPILRAIDGDIDNSVLSYIPNTAEASYMGLVAGFNEMNNELKYERIQSLIDDVTIDPKTREEELRHLLNHSVRAEKIAWKDIKMRTFITEGNSRNDLAAHVYDVTYGCVRPNTDNLIVIDDSIVRGTTLRESIIRILSRLHPKRIVIVSSAPQVRYPDYYGIDMPHLNELIAFKAAVALLKERGEEHRLDDIYAKCKAQEKLAKEDIQTYVTDVYAGFSDEEISKKIVELLRPEGIDTEVHIVYQSLEGLHRAIPNFPGDWYFSGHFPTPGGRKRLNQAFIDYYENSYSK